MVDADFVKKHLKYFQLNLSSLPYHYTSSEASRMTLAFFCISSLDLLGLLEDSSFKEQKSSWIEWIYSQQIVNNGCGGFRGGPFLNSGVSF
jgi:geranylgeranyl transferase type-1 subunit beta